MKIQYLLMSIALLGVAASAAAQESVVSVSTLDALRGDEVSIHSGPGPQYTEIVVSYGGLTVPATGRSNFDAARTCSEASGHDLDMWLRVQFNEIEGWVWRCHPNLKVDGDVSVLPVVVPSHAVLIKDSHYALLTQGNTFPIRYYLATVVLYDAALVRAAPNFDSVVIGKVTFDTSVYVVGRTERAGWVQVVVQGHAGWMASHLLGLRDNWMRLVPVVK